MSKARELAELSRTVSDSADATAITINSDEEVTFASGVTVTGALSATGTSVFASLDISGDIDVDGTTNLDVVDIDGAVDMASTLAVGTRVGIGVAAHASAALFIDTTDQHIRLANGSELGVIELDSDGELNIWAHGDGETINLKTGSGAGTNVLSISGTASTFAGTVTANAGTFNSTIAATSADLRNTSSGAETTALSLRNFAAGANTATALNFYPTQSTARFASIVAENTDGNNNIALSFLTSAGDTPSAALTLNQDRTATFSSSVSTGGDIILPSAGKLYSSGDTDSFLQFNQPNTLRAIIGDSTRMIIEPNTTVFNEDSADADFRVKSVGNANGLMLDASTSTVGVNRAASAGVGLSVNATATNSSTYAFEACNSSSNTKFIVRSDGYSGFYKSSNAGGFIHNTNGAITITPDAGGHFVFNEDGSDADFRVETNGADSAFFVDGSTNNIGIQSGTEWAIVGGGNGTSSSGSSIDMGYDATIYGGSAYWAGGLDIGTNFWRDASGYHYKRTSRQATAYQQNSQGASHSFYSQTSGNAGAVISWNNLLYMDRSQTFFNDTGADTDFRVESDTESNAFTVDGGTGQVGVGSRSGFRFGNGYLQGNAGSSGGGYPVIGYNIRFQGTGGQYGTLVADTSWRMDIGDNNRLTVHSRSATAAVTGAATYTSGPYVALNGTSWTSGSDARLKENVNTITGAIDKVKAMRPVNYTWIHDGEGASNQVGFIAQEMALVVPEVVDIPEDDEVHLGIQYEKLVPVLTAALQEALTKIENLEARIAALES
jgi:hypothetical protein